MIKLDVQEYCHGCANFTADVKEPEKYHADFDIIEMTDTLVRCEHLVAEAGASSASELTQPILRETVNTIIDGKVVKVYKDEIEKQLCKELYSHLGLQFGG